MMIDPMIIVWGSFCSYNFSFNFVSIDFRIGDFNCWNCCFKWRWRFQPFPWRTHNCSSNHLDCNRLVDICNCFHWMLWGFERITKTVDGCKLAKKLFYILCILNSDIFFQFAFLLGIIFIIEIAVGIAAITFRNDLRDILNTQLQKSMNRQNKVSQAIIELMME